MIIYVPKAHGYLLQFMKYRGKSGLGEFYPTCHDKVNEREVKTITGKFQVRVIP